MRGSRTDLRSRAPGAIPVLDGEPEIRLGDLPHASRPQRRRYVALHVKLLLVVVAALGWAGISLWLSIPWVEALGQSIPLPLAVSVILGIAIVPGYLNANLIASLLIDRPPALRFDLSFPAAHRDDRLLQRGGDDRGDARLRRRAGLPGRAADPRRRRRLHRSHGRAWPRQRAAASIAASRVLSLPHGGKARTLTRALAEVTTPLVATVDADTLLMPSALKRLVSRLLVSPPDTVAVAGAVFVRNSRRNMFTRAQEWDYFLGIASVKRQQSLFQSTMVAQGAFSLYRTALSSEAGGWPDRIGEDIVLTWAMMRGGGRVGYERTAVAFTGAPEDDGAFARQRRRWARGMIEGLREHGGALLAGRRTNVHAVLVNFVFPYVDIVYSVAFPMGIALALCGNFAIVGPMTLAVLPLNFALSAVMFHINRRSFARVGLKVRRNRLGFLAYLLATNWSCRRSR